VKDNFDKWCAKKREEELKERLQQKRIKNLKQENLIQKKQESENAYNIWLKESRRKAAKKKNERNSPVHSFYKSPNPSYTNPLPWVSVAGEEEETVIKNKQKGRYCSPPLLWQERETRQMNRRLSRKSPSGLLVK